MRKNILAVSIAAMIGGLGFAGAASAGVSIPAAAAPNPATVLEVTPEGTGHILLVPYFSTQNGNVSLLNIVNTDTTNGKAVKLRYRGAANSDDIYDITIFLSPGDVWSAEVSQKDGVSYLTTPDNSCTLPASVNAPFATNRVKGGDKAQTLEGYIEILNMADVPAKLVDDAGVTVNRANALYTAIKHVKGVAPCATIPSQLADLGAAGAALDGTDATDLPLIAATPNAWNVRGYAAPSGGLMANWSIVNISKAGSFTGDATAVVAKDAAGPAGVPALGNIVFSPQSAAAQPAATIAGLTADPLLVVGSIWDKDGVWTPTTTAPVKAALYDFPDLSTPYVGAIAPLAQANMLAGAVATLSVTNEYLTNPAVSFATDWTFSMPTRRYNVALDYANSRALFTATAETDPANVATTYFSPVNTSLNAAKTLLCVRPEYSGTSTLSYRDQSEQTSTGGYVISPGDVTVLDFCGETNVLSFNNEEGSVLGSVIARKNIQTVQSATTTAVYTDGWMKLGTPGLPIGAGAGAPIGLPILGHAYAKALGVAASLGGIWKHRTDRTEIDAP